MAGNAASTPGSFLQRSSEISFDAWALGNRRAYAGANPANRWPGGEDVDDGAGKAGGDTSKPPEKTCPELVYLKGWADTIRSSYPEGAVLAVAVGCGICNGNVNWFVARSTDDGEPSPIPASVDQVRSLAKDAFAKGANNLIESRGKCHAEINVGQAMLEYNCKPMSVGISQAPCPSCKKFLDDHSIAHMPEAARESDAEFSGNAHCRGDNAGWRRAVRFGGPGGDIRRFAPPKPPKPGEAPDPTLGIGEWR